MKLMENEQLTSEQYNNLEQELGAIADNMSEGCYSNDPDDCVDWRMCPGLTQG